MPGFGERCFTSPAASVYGPVGCRPIRHGRELPLRTALFCLLFLAFSGPVWALDAARRVSFSPHQGASVDTGLQLYAAQYMRTTRFDTGSLQVFLRNTSAKSLRLSAVRLNGIALPVIGVGSAVGPPPETGLAAPGGAHATLATQALGKALSARRVLWGHLHPASIPPQGLAELRLKLAREVGQPQRLDLWAEGEKPIQVILRPVELGLRLPAVTFSEGFDEVLVYIENTGVSPLKIATLEVNGADVTDSSTFLGATKGLAPGKVGLAAVSLSTPLQRGEDLFAMVETTDRRRICGRVRVQRDFPIHMEGGHTGIEGLGLDSGPYVARFGMDSFKRVEAMPDRPTGVQLLACPMHAFRGDLARAGQEILTRYAAMRRWCPSHPGFVVLCRCAPEAGYALFGEAADILNVQPTITTSMETSLAEEEPVTVVGRIVDSAFKAVAPKPVHALMTVTRLRQEDRLDTPKGLRQRLYAALASGAKGLLYRLGPLSMQARGAAPLAKELRRCNAEVRVLRSLLAQACPVPWSKAVGDGDARSLLCGSETLALVVFEGAKGEDSGERVEVHLELPARLGLHRAQSLTPGGLVDMEVPQRSGDGVHTLLLPCSGGAQIFVFDLMDRKCP